MRPAKKRFGSRRSSTRPTVSFFQKSVASRTPSPKTKAAEKAWIAYRDAYIEATYPAKDKAAEYGSMYALDVALLHAKLTQRQPRP
jgi:uncharacterized protein YecT (DUF1311 family)